MMKTSCLSRKKQLQQKDNLREGRRMSLDENQKTFIGYLLNLAKEGHENRGALADLRSGLGKKPGEMARVYRHVAPYLPEKSYNDHWYYLTATLFGLHPKHREPIEHVSNGMKWKDAWTFGRAFRPLREKSDSMEARFIALLNAHADNLDDHLRHAVSLLKANEQPLDWFRFFEDLLQWDHPDGHVQLRWARDFYRGGAGDTSSAVDTEENQVSKQEVEKHE
jgi:CRISPR system Cascade subunit CasB